MYLSSVKIKISLQIIIYSNLKVKIIAWSKVLLLVIQPKYFQAPKGRRGYIVHQWILYLTKYDISDYSNEMFCLFWETFHSVDI